MKEPLFEIDINSKDYSEGMKMSGGKYFYERLTINRESRRHYHNCYELEIIISGETTQNIDGSDYDLKRGSVTFISPKQIHYIAPPKKALELISIKITPEAINGELGSVLGTVNFPVLGKLNNNQLELFLQMFNAFDGKEIANSKLRGEAIGHQISSFLCLLVDSFGISSFPEQGSSAKSMLKTVGYIKENILKPITLKSVSAEFGYTPGYFSAKFKEFTGKGFARFVQEERLLLAYRAICTTDDPISEISVKCGFESFPYFSRAFKAKYGKPPSCFREK